MKLPKEVRAALDATGLPWELRNGSKHQLLFLDGHMLTIIPRGRGGKQHGFHALANVLANIRRFQRQRTGA